MSVFSNIKDMLDLYGSDVAVKDKFGEFEGKAIIQPLMYKNKMYLGGEYLPAGYFDGGHYLMIAPCEDFIRDYRSTVITQGNEKYTIKRSELVSVQNKGLYIWAVLTPCCENLEDDYEKTSDVA